ncbi:MAG: 1-aminocyclopropane-1-carboxylate deaminase/D-cysteine desulfhydrase [Woeseiaceae bacterium]
MADEKKIDDLLHALETRPRARLAQLPTPVHRLENFGREVGDIELWIKRDDLTGLEGGGNKTRKLEYLVGDAIEAGADTLVTAGAIQSNHTRQTAAAAARCTLKCALLHFGWTKDAGPHYRQVGNILLSSTMGAELFLDETPRPIEDQGPLLDFCEFLKDRGHKPYLIPAGASEHRLGSLGYMECAAEIVNQCKTLDTQFDYILHCTGSSSTQAGLLAGFAAIGSDIHVIGVADDEETQIKQARVLKLANDALMELEISASVSLDDVHVVAADQSPYGTADSDTLDAIRLLARTEGLIADPVYEGKALRGLLSLAQESYFESGSRVLLMHLGGTPAVHAYVNQLGLPEFSPFPA